MKLTEFKDAKVTWVTVMNYFQSTPRHEGTLSITMFIQESEVYSKQFTWIALLLWCAVRTKFFTSKAWTDDLDPGALGEKNQTIRQGVQKAAKEFSKFDDSQMLDEEEAMIKEYWALLEFAQKDNPNAEEPITEPVKPKPIPIPVPPPVQPEPVEPEKPEAKPEPQPVPGSWKTKFAWIGGVASVLSASYYIWSLFVPAPVAGIIKVVLLFLKEFF